MAGAPGTVSVYVNGTKQQSANIAKVYDTFAFDENITLSKGRNEVKLVLEYNNGLQVVKTLNYVYLSTIIREIRRDEAYEDEMIFLEQQVTHQNMVYHSIRLLQRLLMQLEQTMPAQR